MRERPKETTNQKIRRKYF